MGNRLNFAARLVVILLVGTILAVSAPLAFFNRLSLRAAAWLVSVNDRLAAMGGA